MRIEHLAIWVNDLDVMKAFYTTYFDGRAGELYHNPKKDFTSYFISFEEGCRLEIMKMPAIVQREGYGREVLGLAHFALSVGSKEKVNELTERLRSDGYSIAGEPRTTGDGYYESVVLDPEGNRVEITI